MKRTATGTAAAVVAILSLTACSSSGGNGGGGGDAGGGEGEAVNLVVWESLEGRQEFIERAGEAFTAENPNVTIEYKNVELGDALGQIALDGPAGVGADVFAAPSNVAGDLVTGGHILPVADPDALTSELADGAIQSVTYEDQIWGVPVTLDTYALFYNKEYVQDPPKTWADLIAFSEQFSADNPGKYGFGINPAVYYAAPFLFESPDNLLFGPEGDDPTTPNTDTAAAVEGMEEFVQLRQAIDTPAADLDAASVDALFQGGQTAMTITGAWNIPVFDDAGLDYGVATLPARAGRDTPSGSFANSRTMFVSAYSEHPEEAQEFAAFLASPEMLELAYEITGSVPPADIPIEHEATLGMIEQGKYAFSTPSIPEMTNFWTTMDSAVANIWNGADIQSELTAATTAMAAS